MQSRMAMDRPAYNYDAIMAASAKESRLIDCIIEMYGDHMKNDPHRRTGRPPAEVWILAYPAPSITGCHISSAQVRRLKKSSKRPNDRTTARIVFYDEGGTVKMEYWDDVHDVIMRHVSMASPWFRMA